ncbi:hypothetical protein R6Z07M_012680 [Ovis aries]
MPDFSETTSTVSGDHDAEDAVSRRKDTASFFPGLRRTQRLPAKENANCSLCGNCGKGRFTTVTTATFRYRAFSYGGKKSYIERTAAGRVTDGMKGTCAGSKARVLQTHCALNDGPEQGPRRETRPRPGRLAGHLPGPLASPPPTAADSAAKGVEEEEKMENAHNKLDSPAKGPAQQMTAGARCFYPRPTQNAKGQR